MASSILVEAKIESPCCIVGKQNRVAAAYIPVSLSSRHVCIRFRAKSRARQLRGAVQDLRLRPGEGWFARSPEDGISIHRK